MGYGRVPIVAVKAACGSYILLFSDAMLGMIDAHPVRESVVISNGYQTLDVRDSSLPTQEYHDDLGTLIVQAGENDFIFYRQSDKPFRLSNPKDAAKRFTVFDVRRPRTEAEWEQRHERWCNEDGRYVLCFNRRADIKG